MIIYLDIDGTVCRFAFPHIGKYNEGCQEVLYKLQDAGHQIIINSYRCDLMDDTLQEAIAFLATLKTKEPITDHTIEKIMPDHWNVNNPPCLFLDDISIGIPTEIEKGNLYVNWFKVDKQLEENGFYKKK